MNGIDISSYQSGIDLAVVPCDFVIVKATEGTGYVNPDYARAYNQAVQCGKHVGIYHYANGQAGAEAEADYFLYYVGSRLYNAVLVLDWESGGNVAFNNPLYAKAFLDRVYAKTGVRPLIYMSKSVTYQYDWSAVANDYGLWVAQYANYNPTGYQSEPWTDANGFGAFGSPVIFQYSSTGRLNGWNGNLDLNIAYMDGKAWNKYAGKSDEKEDDEMTQEQFNQFMENYLAERNKKNISDWAKEDFEKAVKDGITTGERPQALATREETAIMINRALHKE